MNARWLLSLFLAGALVGAGCDRSHGLSSAPPDSPKPVNLGQPKLSTIKLWLGPQEIVAEQALTQPQITSGLMFRKQMAEHEGMLFVFGEPHRASFWMKNTLLPLSCAYIDSQGVILEIRDMKPLDETPIAAASDRVQYVLEMNQGWFDRNNVRTGMVVRTERGSLGETYFGK